MKIGKGNGAYNAQKIIIEATVVESGPDGNRFSGLLPDQESE